MPVNIGDDTPLAQPALYLKVLMQTIMLLVVFATEIKLQRLHDVFFGDGKTFLMRPFEQHDEIVDLVQGDFSHERANYRAGELTPPSEMPRQQNFCPVFHP